MDTNSISEVPYLQLIICRTPPFNVWDRCRRIRRLTTVNTLDVALTTHLGIYQLEVVLLAIAMCASVYTQTYPILQSGCLICIDLAYLGFVPCCDCNKHMSLKAHMNVISYFTHIVHDIQLLNMNTISSCSIIYIMVIIH